LVPATKENSSSMKMSQEFIMNGPPPPSDGRVSPLLNNSKYNQALPFLKTTFMYEQLPDKMHIK
jgi:hypothetical protein